jgi:flagellar P-ring protein precursor FlgI
MFRKATSLKIWAAVLLSALLTAQPAGAVRIKDMANILGVRSNQLIGFGLVIGLAGTGDRANNVFFSIQSVVNMLRKLGVTVPEGRVQQLQFKNVATVLVTADLPAFAKQGDHLDVVVSSLADAKSLQGGTLLLTPIKGPDGKVYSVAQGPLSIGGFPLEGGGARNVQKNHLTVGRIANGAIVEKELPSDLNFNAKEEIFLTMKKTDFTTADRIARAVNDDLKDVYAMVIDGRTIRVKVPEPFKNSASVFITRVESLDVRPDTVAKVIIDERTGTVVMGESVRLSTVAVSHGNLFIQVREAALPAQAPSTSPAQAIIPPRNRVLAEAGEDRILVLPEAVKLGDVVNGLNSIGINPRDLIAILQAIKAAGALHAELEII